MAERKENKPPPEFHTFLDTREACVNVCSRIRLKRSRDWVVGFRLVFTSDGVGVGAVSGVARKSAYDLMKTKVGVVSGVISATESESEESERFHFFRHRLRLRRLRSNQIVAAGSRSGRINQSQCTFPRFLIRLVFLLLLPTPTIWFSLDHKRNVSDGIVSGIETLFSLDHKLYASD